LAWGKERGINKTFARRRKASRPAPAIDWGEKKTMSQRREGGCFRKGGNPGGGGSPLIA